MPLGRCFSTAATGLWRRGVPLTVLAVACHLPGVAFELAFDWLPADYPPDEMPPYFMWFLAAMSVLVAVGCWAATIAATFGPLGSVLRGEQRRWTEDLARGFGDAWRALPAALWFSVRGFGPLAAAVGLQGLLLLGEVAHRSTCFAAVLSAVVFLWMCFDLPTQVLTVPCALDGGLGPFAASRASRKLVQSCRLKAFFVVLLWFVGHWLVFQVADIAALPPVVLAWVQQLLHLLGDLALAVILVVVHHHLRSAQRVDVERVADVF